MSKDNLSIKFEVNIKANTAFECVDSLLEAVEDISIQFMPLEHPLIEAMITKLRYEIEMPRSESIDDEDLEEQVYHD